MAMPPVLFTDCAIAARAADDGDGAVCCRTFIKSNGCPTNTLQKPPTAPGANPTKDAMMETVCDVDVDDGWQW